MRTGAKAGVAIGTLLALAGGYVLADAADVVPGWITAAPPPPIPAPLPVAASAEPLDSAPIVASYDADAPMPSASKVAQLAATLHADPRVNATTAILVVDIPTGTVLADVYGDSPRVPASTTKLVTALAALHVLGADTQFATTLTWAGAGTDGTPRITLVAGGDMLLGPDSGHGGSVWSANAYAGLGDLADDAAAALAAEGVDRVTLTVDDSAFGGPTVPSIWSPGAVEHGYVAPITGLAVDVGVVPGTWDPDGEESPQRYADPSVATANVLATRLGERGITVVSVARGAAGSNDVVLASVESAPVSSLVSYMLRYSDNTVAEVLDRAMGLKSRGKGTTDNGVAVALQALRDAGIDTTGITLYDGSGYSSHDRIPARALVDILLYLATSDAEDWVLEELPVSALRGTLYERFVGTDAAGLVRAKTGSLSGVTALAGTVVTADGRWLAFAVLADGLPWGQTRPRAAIDEFVAALASCGCR